MPAQPHPPLQQQSYTLQHNISGFILPMYYPPPPNTTGGRMPNFALVQAPGGATQAIPTLPNAVPDDNTVDDIGAPPKYSQISSHIVLARSNETSL